jgi:hypothetical protein
MIPVVILIILVVLGGLAAVGWFVIYPMFMAQSTLVSTYQGVTTITEVPEMPEVPAVVVPVPVAIPVPGAGGASAKSVVESVLGKDSKVPVPPAVPAEAAAAIGAVDPMLAFAQKEYERALARYAQARSKGGKELDDAKAAFLKANERLQEARKKVHH